jgi:molecular chaperone GrpE
MSEDNIPDDEPFTVDGAADDRAELAAAQAELAALKEQVLRYAAAADNTRRRAEREANDARAYAIQKFARDLLGVADNLARAMASQPADTGDAAVKNFVVGVEMTEKELLQAFDRNGLVRVAPAKGEKFDPHKHQAVMEQPGTDVAAGGVVSLLQPGYELLGRLVRPAMVVVAAKGAAAPDSGANGQGNGNPYGAGDDGAGGSVDTRA